MQGKTLPLLLLRKIVQVLSPLTIYMDNKGAILMAFNLVTSKRFRNCIAKELFKVEYASPVQNIGFIITMGKTRNT